VKNIFEIGDKKSFVKEVQWVDLAHFEQDRVHEVYGTFALGRDAEWCCRLYVLEMKETHEEGIGTYLKVVHQSPALLGQIVNFEATIIKLERNEIICSFIARVGDRIIATGEQGQKIISKEKLANLFETLK
jgi:predicted thioesterase